VTAGIEEHHGRIQLTIGKTVLTATLLGNAASRNFAALIPSDLPLRDFAAAEKISDPPARLSPADSPAGATPDIGDIAYYAHPGATWRSSTAAPAVPPVWFPSAVWTPASSSSPPMSSPVTFDRAQ
jgi:hypothetical protein